MPDNYNSDDFEKMKQQLIESGFDWNNLWAYLPFIAVLLGFVKNPCDMKGNDSYEW